MFERALPSISAISSLYLKPERLLRIALIARSRSPGLRRCTPQSFLQALMQAAEVGLEPNTPLEHAWLIPYKNKYTGTTEAQFQIGYKGYVHMARRSGVITSVRARLVRANDHFELVEGTDRRIIHRPLLLSDRGEVVMGYAIAELAAGGVEWDTMTRAELDAVRDRSRAGNEGPWVTDLDAMYRKTVLRKVLKQLDLTEEMATALSVERGAEDRSESDDTVIDILAGARNSPALADGEDGDSTVRGKRRKP
jgi:recombination protein RecT